MSEKESTALAPIVKTMPPEVGGPLSFESLTNDFFSTIPDRAKTIRYLQGSVTPLEEMIGKTITVEHVLAHRVQMVDEKTGEIKEGVRIVLAGDGDKAYQAVSQGVKNSLRLIAQLYGKPPWKDGLKLQVNQIRTRRAFRTFTLTPVA